MMKLENIQLTLWASILSLWSFSLFAQQEISIHGKIYNDEKEPISYATIILNTPETDKTLAFTFTDSLGRYNVSLNFIQEAKLIISSLGYQSDTTTILLSNEHINYQQNIRLKRINLSFEEVEITDYRIPYKVEGDTIEYDAKFYADQGDRVVEDLVKKLPGVKVQDNGDIHYKGKRVEKVLLENDELFGNNYTLGTKNMNAEVVDKIQFIDHYLDNHLLKDVKESEQLVMNITVKEDRKKLLFGNSEIGGGSPTKHDILLNIFSLYKESKAFIIGSSNNIGNANFSIGDYTVNSFDFHNEPYEYQRPATYFSHLEIPSHQGISNKERKKNTAQFGAINAILNPSEKVKITINTHAFKEKVNLRHQSLFQDLLFQDIFEISEQESLNYNTNGQEANLEVEYQISKSSNLKYQSNLHISHYDGLKETIIEQEEVKNAIPQTLKNEQVKQKHSLNYVKKIRMGQVLVVDATLFQDKKPQTFSFESNNFGNIHFINQSSKHTVSDIDIKTNLLGKINSSFLKYAFSLGFRKQGNHIISSIQDNSLSILPLLSGNDFNLRNNNLFAGLSLWKKINKFKVSLDAKIGRSLYLFSAPSDYGSEAQNYQNLKLGYAGKLNRKWSISNSYSYKTNLPDVNELLPGYIFTSFRSVYSGLPVIKPLIGHNIIGFLKYTNNRKLLEAHISLMYSFNNRYYGNNYFYDQLLSISSKSILGKTNQLNLNFNLDKFLSSISSNIGIYINYTKRNYPIISPSHQIVNSGNLFSQLSFTTAFDGNIDLGVITKASISRFRAVEENRQGLPLLNSNTNYQFKYFATFKPSAKWFFKLNTRHFARIGNGQKNYFFTDFEMKYLLNHKIDIALRMYNLLNHKNFEIEYLGNQSYNSSNFILNPRFTLLYLNLKF